MIELKIKGQTYVDYSSATLNVSMEELARTFYFKFSDKWLQTGVLDLPFIEGDPCTVSLNGKVVIDGYVDDLPIDYDSNTHSISIAGRSWTGHLVDCSAIYKTGSWRQVDLITLVKNVCEPFGIDVMIDPWALAYTGGPFARWSIEAQETAFDFIQRVLKERGLFAVSDAGRKVVITKASERMLPGAIVFGQNAKRASRVSRFSDRYSQYIIKGQSAGSDEFHGADITKKSVSVSDPQVTAYRPLLIISDGTGKVEELQSRAEWERNVRAGRSRRFTYTLQGDATSAGAEWEINKLISVTDKFLDLKEPLLVAGFNITHNASGGTSTTVELCAPQAFDVLKPPKPRPKKGGKQAW